MSYETREEQIKGLVSLGIKEPRAIEIVDAGKFGETVDDLYEALVVDPIGWFKRNYVATYASAETIRKPIVI